MKVTLNTSEYERSHGRKPKGRGLWMLSLTIHDGQGGYADEDFEYNGTLTEAKKAARDHVRNCGRAKEVIVTVLP